MQLNMDETLKALMDLLIESGYPEESLLVEWPVGKSKVDLAIRDLYTEELIAFFIITGRKTKENEGIGKMELKKYLYTLRNPNIQTYIVYRLEGIPPFEVQKIEFEWDKSD